MTELSIERDSRLAPTLPSTHTRHYTQYIEYAHLPLTDVAARITAARSLILDACQVSPEWMGTVVCWEPCSAADGNKEGYFLTAEKTTCLPRTSVQSLRAFGMHPS